MRTITIGQTQINYSLGSILAIIVLILCVVWAAASLPVTPLFVFCLIGALALAILI